LIKEIIVVEGKDDIRAVKNAVDAEVIATGGYGYSKELINRLKKISERRGVIILTDPDFEGERIRRNISKDLKNCKHAFLPRRKALKKGDIGVENAGKEDIIEALKKARPASVKRIEKFTHDDMINFGLTGSNNSKRRREILGEILGIGYGNSKQFLNRLNNYGISKEEFIDGLKEMEKWNGR
jgi:ribonuclease M5